MKRLLLLLALASSPALAGTAVVTWTNPTSRIDNTPIAPATITATKVEYGTCSSATGAITVTGTVSAAGAVQTLTLTLPAGAHCVRAYTQLSDGTESLASNVGFKLITPSPPKPPVIVTVDQTAYLLRPSLWGLVRLVRVEGQSLPVGVACDALIPGLWGYGVVGSYIGRCGVA